MKIATPILVALAGCGCLAQSPTAPPAFDAATVRIADPAGFPGPRVRTSPDSLTIHGSSLRDCIQVAYQLPATQVTGPDWLSDIRLDIAVKAGGPVEEKQLYLMLRTLLAERLGVKTHMERSETAVFALTVTKSGPKFSESTTQGPPSGGRRGDQVSFERFSMSDLAVALSQPFGRPVVDATGLKGRYDIHLDMTPYAPAETAAGQQGTPVDTVSMMITALQEQMGLKVESRKDQIDILVVDHAEKTPVEN
jgi:uncharacterized protein (TIGR03435 family)